MQSTRCHLLPSRPDRFTFAAARENPSRRTLHFLLPRPFRETSRLSQLCFSLLHSSPVSALMSVLGEALEASEALEAGQREEVRVAVRGLRNGLSSFQIESVFRIHLNII